MLGAAARESLSAAAKEVKVMKRLVAIALLFTVLLLGSSLYLLQTSAMAGNVPDIVYLGAGGSYTIEPGRNFIVKRLNPFRFDLEPGPNYTAVPGEDVWSTNNGPPPASYHNWLDFGPHDAGCIVRFLAIDDNVDERVNRFYVDGAEVYAMPQGMVTSGEFTLPTSGQLTLYAEDSIGMWVDVCNDHITETPTPTDTPTHTPTHTPTPSATPTGTLTPTITPSATATTPSATSLPPIITPTASATATKIPRQNACLRINFEQGGDSAIRGTYVVEEVGGRVLFRWFAEDGWIDSGWVHGIDITFPSVFVRVIFIPEDGSMPINMRIVNPAPGTEYGWLSRGMCHALEIAWPDPNTAPTPVPTTTSRGSGTTLRSGE